MGVPYDTDDLISGVQNAMMLPNASSGSFSPTALLQYATWELQGPVMALILAAREKYYLTSVDIPIVASTSYYSIPERAAGGLILLAQYVNGNQITELPPLDPKETYTNNTGTPRAMLFQNNYITLYPIPTQTVGTLRLYYYQRPSTLEQTINCAQITMIGSGQVTVANVPSTWATGTLVDFIPQTLPYTPYGLDTSITSISGDTIVLPLPTSGQSSPNATPTPAPKVGDWLAIAEYTPIPEILREVFPVLMQATVCKVLEAAGDAEKLAQAQAKLASYIAAAKTQIQPRSQSGSKQVRSGWWGY
jgi:hypothetical protein